jgi:type VI secretion system protein ImpL
VARVVERQFQTLRDAAGQPTEDVLRTISELYVLVQRIASSPPGTVLPAPAPGSLDPGQRLEAEAARLPDPLGRWLKGLAQSIATIRFGGAKAAIAAAGAQQLAPLCRNIEQRFPFRPTGPDMPVDDFARLFGPGGVFDQFFAGQIRPFVDTTQNPWRPVAAGGMAPPVIAADVQQFQRAQAIRDAFFPGGAGLGLRFELVPTGAMDPGANAAVLEAEGLRNEIPRAGPFRPIPLAWPARGNLTLTFDPPSAAGPLSFDGGWSGLRLVIRPQSTLQTTPQRERLRLNVVHGDRSIAFELRAGSVQHPFGLPELTQFRCPTLAP